MLIQNSGFVLVKSPILTAKSIHTITEQLIFTNNTMYGT